ATASEVALDEARPIDERKAAIALLAGAPLDDVEPVVEDLLAARQPLDVQQAAVAALSLVDDPRAASRLLANWPGYSPKVQDTVLAELVYRAPVRPLFL
ncbi:MAG: hypothetical protein ACK2UQ_10940, partial [Anaerolineae bacterium]